MSVDIDQILPRRSDLSTFLVHLSRRTANDSAKNILCKIIEGNRLIAGKAFGPACSKMEQAGWNITDQRCVCFTEVPLEHISLLTEIIKGRIVAMEPYGIAVAKKYARKKDVNPVWYIDQTPGHDWLTTPLNNIVAAVIKDNEKNHSILKLTPFIEQFGEYKDFHWEREWRCIGDFHLPTRFLVIAPEADHAELTSFIANNAPYPNQLRLIDAHWGLEKTIARLAGYRADEL